ncbi:MAG: hypothetical protein LBF94_02305 [Puniceicoccales bacterium]|jgi:hypothetical protein|nr:hypothetical protein [Puniceicoccales bacterium]
MMKSIDLANSPVINDGQAVFEVVSERDGGGLPAVLKLTLGSRLRQSLESEDNMVIPGKRPDLGLIKIELDGRKVIDCAANAQVLYDLQWEDLENGYIVSAAKFILDWSESDGILVKNKDSLKDIRMIILSFCASIEWLCGRVYIDQQEMQMMFREFSRDFSSFMWQGVPRL